MIAAALRPRLPDAVLEAALCDDQESTVSSRYAVKARTEDGDGTVAVGASLGFVSGLVEVSGPGPSA